MIKILAALALFVAAATPKDTLSDDTLVAYASQPFNKAQMSGLREILGIHHGTNVLADFPCSDLCPSYTVRVIHYDVEPGPACDAIGGAARAQLIPVSITSVMRRFCVPKILVDKKLY